MREHIFVNHNFFQVDRLIKVTNDVNDATSESDDDEDEDQKYQLTQWFPSDFSATDQVRTFYILIRNSFVGFTKPQPGNFQHTCNGDMNNGLLRTIPILE